jgi:hypothetical protein
MVIQTSVSSPSKFFDTHYYPLGNPNRDRFIKIVSLCLTVFQLWIAIMVEP